AAGYVVVRATGLGPSSTWWTDAGGWVGSGRGPVPPPLLLAFLAVGVLVVVAAWIRTPRLRPVVTATVVLLTCAAIPGPHTTTALLLALPALALQAAVVIDDLTAGSQWRRRAALTAVLSTAALVPIFAPQAPQAP